MSTYQIFLSMLRAMSSEVEKALELLSRGWRERLQPQRKQDYTDRNLHIGRARQRWVAMEEAKRAQARIDPDKTLE